MNILRSDPNDSNFIENILSAVNVPVILTEINGTISFANYAVIKTFGFLPEEIVGKELSILLTPEDRDIFYQNLLGLSCDKSSFEGELMLIRKDGTSFFSYLTAQTCTADDGRAAMVICIQDIHEFKLLEKARRINSYDDLTQIANGIAHEIRNPLVGIGGFLNRLYKSCNAIDEHGQYYEYIIENLTKIEDLVEKVEFFSKIPEPDITKENVWELIEQALNPYLPELDASNIKVETYKEDIVLHLDSILFSKVISVLIENSMDALKDIRGGKISIYGEVRENQYVIYINDNGSGISPEDIPFIFNPFFSTKADGKGIDLAIVKRIMENHNGKVEIESEQDKGTRFSLTLPIERRRSIRIKLIDKS
ncbi:nitrogen regulation protein NR(II) [Thermodesulfobacteriota bacterium]